MELKDVSSETGELRSIIIASNMTSCYLMIDQLLTHGGTTLHYDDFRREWILLFKEVYQAVSKMRPRNEPR